jgi:hypothetical protein
MNISWTYGAPKESRTGDSSDCDFVCRHVDAPKEATPAFQGGLPSLASWPAARYRHAAWKMTTYSRRHIPECAYRAVCFLPPVCF